MGEKTGQPAEARRQTARLLVICDPAALRDPPAAIRYARRAIELTKGEYPLAATPLCSTLNLFATDREGPL